VSTDTGSISQGKSSGIVRSETYAEHEDRVRADRTAPVCLDLRRKRVFMKISKLLNCIQENLNSGCLTLDSEVYIRNDWGDIHPVEDVRIEENELLLADQEPT